jgi:hypothetical protein
MEKPTMLPAPVGRNVNPTKRGERSKCDLQPLEMEGENNSAVVEVIVAQMANVRPPNMMPARISGWNTLESDSKKRFSADLDIENDGSERKGTLADGLKSCIRGR